MLPFLVRLRRCVYNLYMSCTIEYWSFRMLYYYVDVPAELQRMDTVGLLLRT